MWGAPTSPRGIAIQEEAIVHGEHALYMIVESSDEARIREFMRPFSQAGEVNVYPAATCAGVVSSGRCGAARTTRFRRPVSRSGRQLTVVELRGCGGFSYPFENIFEMSL
jgi:hypothetical protein